MSKRTIYTIFLAKFAFSLALIIWTITITMGAGVGLDDDNSFMSDYKISDASYNIIMANNITFDSKYNLELNINDKDIPHLSYKDIYLSQRVIKKRIERKNLLKIGENKFNLVLRDKKSNKIIDNFDAKIILTLPSSHLLDQEIILSSSSQDKIVNITKKSYWNIMATVKVNNEESHFYIKTNAM